MCISGRALHVYAKTTRCEIDYFSSSILRYQITFHSGEHCVYFRFGFFNLCALNLKFDIVGENI